MVEVDTQVGFAADDDKPKGTVPLAGTLRRLCADKSWLAIVADDGGARFAVIHQVQGMLLADCDHGYGSQEDAMVAFAAARERVEGQERGGALLASPGLLGEDPAVRVVEGRELAAVAKGLKTVRRVRGVHGRWRARALDADRGAGAVHGRAAAPGISRRKSASRSMESRSRWRRCKSSLQRRTRPRCLKAARRRFGRNLLHLGGWQTQEVDCYAQFKHGQILSVRPELRNRPALLAVWKLGPGLEAPAHRRLAERGR